MIRKVRNCCETCENLVCVATTIGQLQHTEYLKPTFLETFKWAIRPVFPETVTYVVIYGLDECSKGTPRHEQFNHDLDKVTTIVTDTESSINPLSIRDILRLGKYHEGHYMSNQQGI